MSTPSFDVAYVSHLARLDLTPDEARRTAAQLGQVLDYMAKLQAVDVSGVEPMAHAVPLVNVSRPDVAEVCLPPADALRNAPAQANGLFLVPKIVE